jgi:lysophospholipase L1-like esterase
MVNRRNALKSLSAIGAATIGSGLLAHSDLKELNLDLSNKTILFQGDSITDAGRDKARHYPNQGGGMGEGYVRHIVTELLGRNPTSDLKVYNRGISGNKVFQLKNRWEDDCLQLKPDVLSIMIGVNDFWHTLSHNYKGTAATYEKNLDELIRLTKEELPAVQLIIGEPFVCHEGTAIATDKWKGSFEKYQQACRRVSDEHSAIWVPYQSVFDKALKVAPTSYWCPDGVHPSMAGNYLMAQAWLSAFSQI